MATSNNLLNGTNMKKILAVLIGTVLLSISTLASESNVEDVRQAFAKLANDPNIEAVIEESDTPGIFMVSAFGQIYHVYFKDDVLLIGEAYDIEKGVNLTDQIKNQAISGLVNNLPVEGLIVFPATDVQRHITVFTDIDCGYCRRFHQGVPELTQAGLEVRYAAYPRAGIPSSSFDKIVTVWCSEDQQKAMTAAKSGINLPELNCQNPVAEHFQAGVEAGIQGTPTLVLDDGTVIPGFVPAEQLLSQIGLVAN